VTRIAFIGLGIMRLLMATNLVTAGYDVQAYNRRPPGNSPGLWPGRSPTQYGMPT
jgi:3-hydroxyisobutyrate dehydrogenase-like beta-hydroxyacid dehydrogenase